MIKARRGKETQTKPVYHRNHQTLRDEVVSPEGPMGKLDKRHIAIVEVLRRLPEDAYRSFAEQIDRIHWFVPHYNVHGMVEPVFATDEFEIIPGKIAKGNRVIYFSPRLENEPLVVIVGVVAHELAHIALKHSIAPPRKEYAEQEKEVSEALCNWGFEKEVKRHRASMAKRRLK